MLGGHVRGVVEARDPPHADAPLLQLALGLSVR
jgi:hypothetical protein